MTPLPLHSPSGPSVVTMSRAVLAADARVNGRRGSTWYMILTLSAGAIVVLATAPASPPATRDSIALTCLASRYVAGVGSGGFEAASRSARLVAGTASLSTSFAVNPIAAAIGPFSHVKPTPLNSPFTAPSFA